jgi:hypothetical protein
VAEVDLELYGEISDFLSALEPEEAGLGAGVVALRWASERGLSEEERDYVYGGFARLFGHIEGRGWRSRPGWEALDQEAWTLYRAWADRYGRSALAAAR